METAELMAAVSPQIRDLGWAFYFTPETIAVGEGIGLDALRFYFLGRRGVLGDVEPEVVISAFGYFSPSIVTHLWNSARQACAPRDAARAFMGCSAALGRLRLSPDATSALNIELDLEAFCAAAGRVNDAADPVGLSLYAGAKAEPLADDLPGRAMQLITVLREHRGSAHLLAVRAVGLDAKTAHCIKRPGDMGLFGWGDDETPDVGDADRAKLDTAERLTDEIVFPSFDVLDDPARHALRSGFEAIAKALA
jgi:hypothetical protein